MTGAFEAVVIGAGLAGVEAASTLARHGVRVGLYEMKPRRYSPAHSYEGFAELVCSNSLKAMRTGSAAGMLKAEMRLLGSLTVEAALKTAVPAGGALAVDREKFSDYITESIKNNPLVTVIHEEAAQIPEKNAIICTGPLTDGALAEEIGKKCGKSLYFYDAAAPIVRADSIDMSKAFFATRYDKGEADYINCPMDKAEYDAFYHELVNAETAPLRDFDKPAVYEGCMPVEVLAKRGIDAVRYGCMKPVGLRDPASGRRPYAVVQLRKENTESSMYNIVGFQTNLRFGEQKRVFGMIPALTNAEFMRYGVMHRNSYLSSPELLGRDFMLRGSENIYFAGQLSGVEGYMESAMSGIIAGLSLARRLSGRTPLTLPKTTMCGALCAYISSPLTKEFQPMGANMGILPPFDEDYPEKKKRSKQERYEEIAGRGLSALEEHLATERNGDFDEDRS